MALHQRLTDELALPEVGFTLVWIVALVLVIPIQLASMILFDSLGADTFAPDLVFMAVVPALALAVLPTLIARYYYSSRTTLVTAVFAVAIFTLITAYTMQFYGLCGPGC